MNKGLLPVFILIHWAISFVCSFYVFYRKNSSLDWLYFSVICITVISWTLTKNECIVSYWEKLCLDETYEFNSDPSLPYIQLFFGDYTGLVTLLLITLTAYNLYVMMTKYEVPWEIKFTFIYLIILPGIKFRLEKFQLS